MAQNKYALTLKGPGIVVNQSISKDLADQIALIVFTHGKVGISVKSDVKIKQDGAAKQTSIDVSDPEISLREFIDQHEPKRIVEIITTVAVYLKSYAKKATFNKADLVSAFEDAGEATPGNFGRDIAWTVKNGWIAPKSGDPDQYYVTKSGTDAVQAKFPNELRQKTKVSAGGRRKKKAV